MQLRIRQMMKKNYAYAASYDDFVSLIEDCADLNELQQIRYNIVSEIAQATAVSTVKRTKALDLELDSSLLDPNKVDLLQACNLKRYIKQLTYAKLQCERRLRLLGVQTNDVSRTSSSSMGHGIDDMAPPFKTVMRNPQLRQQLESYLEQQGESQLGLLKFWMATQELRRLDRKSVLSSAAQLFYTYFHGSNQLIKIDKVLIKGMEGFIIGDRGPESFFQAQDQVWKILEERYYPSFLVVLSCQMTGRQGQHFETDSIPSESSGRERHISWKESSSADSDGVIEWSEQTQVAQSRIEQLDARLTVKIQAMTSLRSISPPDNSLVIALEREVEGLQAERREVENWMNQAESWAANVGHWKATVMIPKNCEDKDIVRFPIEIHLEDEAGMMASSNTSPTSRKQVAMSWVVGRQVAEFYVLHSKLVQQCVWLKSSQLPAVSSKSLFGKSNDRAYLERAQDKLQSFLDTVMADERLNKSEALFTFLHNIPVCLRPSVDVPKKRFFLATLFKGDAPRESEDDVEHESLGGTLDDADSQLFQSAAPEDARDGIAEPIYHLIGEVFELRGVFGWLRRTLVTFVQITYGRTLNRQLREVITSLFTDQAVLSYVQSLIQTWWPEGSLLPAAAARKPDEKKTTKMEARELLVENIPDIVNQLLGDKNARRGLLKVFDALQDERLNKQLFYELVEVLVKSGFSEVAVQ